jgi:hypothetical protein
MDSKTAKRNFFVFRRPRCRGTFYALTTLAIGLCVSILPTTAAEMANSCPVDGCLVTITSVEKAGEELSVTLEANYQPDNARNHLHMWWGEQYEVRQVGRNASSEHGVEQGKWHRHDDYPVYITSGAASIAVRDGSTTLCVTAADRGHNVIDAEQFHCMDVSQHLN